MELWVRSQNKGTLMRVEIFGHTDGVINAYFPNGNVELGIYKSSERALEVLDEISKWLDEMRYLEICIKNNQIHKSKPCVYEMPKE